MTTKNKGRRRGRILSRFIAISLGIASVVLGREGRAQSSSLDHFVWSTVSSPQQAGQPISVTINGRDLFNNPAADFSGAVNLTALSPSAPPRVLISEVETVLNKRVELSNVSSSPVDVGGWRVVFYDAASWPIPKCSFTFPAGTVVGSGTTVQVTAAGFYPGTAPAFSTGIAVGWSASTTAQTAVALLDPSMTVVDFFCAGQSTFPAQITVPSTIDRTCWNGLPVPGNTSGSFTYQRVGHSDQNDAADWTLAAQTFGTVNPGLTTPFQGNLVATTVVPSAVTLTNGQWTGQVTIAADATNLFLRADDYTGHSGDSIAFDVSGLPSLTVRVPHTAFKASAGLVGQGTVLLPAPAANDVVCTLTSSAPAQVAVPPTVTIAAGTSSNAFNVTNFNDGLVTGPQMVTIAASASGFSSTDDTITNFDAVSPTLTVTLASLLTEGATTVGSITTTVAPNSAVRVSLQSSQPDRLQVPDAVILAAGQTTVSFTAAAIDDKFLTGNQTVTVTAAVGGWSNGVAQLTVRENEGNFLSVSIPGPLWENVGTLTNWGTVTLGGAVSSNVTVLLSNDVPARLQAPVSVTIPAGQISAKFDVAVIDNSLVDGDQRVNVSGTNPSFVGGVGSVLIYDNELSGFGLAAQPSAQIAGQSFTVTYVAQNSSGTLLSGYNGTASLSASNLYGSLQLPVSSVTFSNGISSATLTIGAESRGTVLSIDDGQGHKLSSAPFDVVTAKVLNLPISDFLYDASRGQIQAAVSAGASNNAASAISIDPVSLGISGTVMIGTNPGAIALSGDGHYLYVGPLDTPIISRVDLNTRAVDLRFSMGGSNRPELAVLPDDPSSVVASANTGIGLFKNGVQQSNVIGPDSYNDVYYLVFTSPTNLYSISAYGQGVWQLNVVSNGLNYVRGYTGYNRHFYQDGLLISAGGYLREPASYRQVGVFPSSPLVAADVRSGQIYSLSGNTLQIVDLVTSAVVGQISLPITAGTATKLVRCSSNYVAIATAAQLFVLQSDLIATRQGTDLTIAQTVAPGQGAVGSNLTYTITVSNAGPAMATNVFAEDLLPLDTTLISVSTPTGSYTNGNGMVKCNMGDLAVGASATATIVVQPQSPGNVVNQAWVLGDGVNPGNGLSRSTNAVVFGATYPPVTRIAFSAQQLAYDSVRNQLWASVTRYGGAVESNMRAINVSNGLSQTVLPIGYNITHFATSYSQNYLYVVYHSSQDFIRRFNLNTLAVDENFPILDPANQTASAVDIIGIPSYPDGLVVARTGQPDIALYDNGSAIRRAPSGTTPGKLQINPNIPNRFYRLDKAYPFGTIGKFDVSTNPIAQLGSANLFAFPPAPNTPTTSDLRYGAGLMFSDIGLVGDPEALTRVAQLPAIGLVETDPAGGKVFYLTSTPTGYVLQAFDIHTLQALWSAPVSGITGTPSSLVRCGAGLLTFCTSDDQVFILNTATLANATLADLVTSETVSRTSATTNDVVTFSITVSNAGPIDATGVIVGSHFPPSAVLISTSAPGGSASSKGAGAVACVYDLLPAHTSVTATISLQPSQGGALQMVSTATANEFDPTLTNNASTAVTYVQEGNADGTRLLQIGAVSLASDPVRGTLYAALGSGADVESNSIVAIDPDTGGISAPVAIGNGPGKLAVSKDGKFLYVAADAEGTMKRVRLDTFAPDFSFPLVPGLTVQDMDVMPGAPHSVAISLRQAAGSPIHVNLGIYDDGVARAQKTSPPILSDSIVFSDSASTLYAYTSESSGFDLYVDNVNSNGVSVAQGLGGSLVNGFKAYIKYAAGRIYSSSGIVVDPATGTAIGACLAPGIGGDSTTLVEPLADENRIYYLANNGATWMLRAFDATTFAAVGALSLPSVSGTPTSLVRCGTNSIAFATSAGQVFICQRSQITTTDLSLSQVSVSASVFAGSNYTCTVTVTNRGPGLARNVVLTDLVPLDSTVVSAVASSGTVSSGGGEVDFQFGDLPAGTTATATLVLNPSLPGLAVNQFNLRSDSFDADSTDNSTSTITRVLTNSPAQRATMFSVPASDIVFDRIGQKLKLGLRQGNAVISFDPANSQFGSAIAVPGQPGELALSDDSHFLYIALPGTNGIARINTIDGSVDETFALTMPGGSGPYSPGDIQVVPGQPTSLAVSLQSGQGNIGLAIYDDGVPRPQTAPGREFGGTYYLRFSTNAGVLYETIPFYFRKISVTGNGAEMVLENNTLVPDYDNSFEVDNGLIYFNAGRVANPTSLTIVTNLPIGGLLRPDVANNRLYVVTGAGQYAALWQLTVHALDATTYNELWAVPLPVGNGYAAKLLTVGTNGLALLTDANRLFVIRTTDLTQTQADVSISATTAPASATVGTTNTYTYKVVNIGPWTASGVAFSNALPVGATFVAATSSLGTCVFTNGAVTCQFSDINSGGSGTITVSMKANSVGVLTNTAGVSYAFDLNPTNNTTTVQTTINPAPAPTTVSIADAWQLNGNTSSTTMVFSVTLSKINSSTVSVAYRTVDGTATAGTDYVATSGVLTFSPGATIRTLNVSIFPTNIVTSTNRYFYVNLTTFTNVAPGRVAAVGTVLENHYRSMTVSANNVVRSTNGVTNATFTFTLSPPSSSPASALYQTADGTAVAGVDYEAKAGTIYFPAGATNASLTVPVFGSQLAQPNQFFSLLLSQPANTTLNPNEQQVQIINTVPFPAVAILNFQLQGTNGVFGFATIKGRNYRIETSQTVPNNTWDVVTNQIAGTGSYMELQLPATNSASAYYRLVLLPERFRPVHAKF